MMLEIDVNSTLGPTGMERFCFEKLGRPDNLLSETSIDPRLDWPQLLPLHIRLKIVQNGVSAVYRKEFIEYFFQSIPLFEARFLSLAMSSAPTLEQGLLLIAQTCAHPAQWFKAELKFDANRSIFTLYPRIDLGNAALAIVEGILRHLGQHFLNQSGCKDSDIVAYVIHEYDSDCSTHFPFKVHYEQKRIAIELPTDLVTAQSNLYDPDLWQLVQIRSRRHTEESDLFNWIGLIEAQLLQLWLTNGRIPLIKEFAEFRQQSPRSLMRTLRRQGLQYKALTDRLQSERALELLRSGQFTIESIADILGFADSSSFRRSFRRWYDINPSDWQNQTTNTTILCTPLHTRFASTRSRNNQNGSVEAE